MKFLNFIVQEKEFSEEFCALKINTSKTEALNLSKNPVQCLLQFGVVSFNEVGKKVYVSWISFTSD